MWLFYPFSISYDVAKKRKQSIHIIRKKLRITLVLLSMADELQKAHLYYDDINKIRVLDPSVLKDTENLRDTCKEYETKVKGFGKIISTLLDTLKELGENVEKQKMAAIGSMNLLKSVTKQRENEQAKLQGEIRERTMLLEHLDSEHDSLQILEANQMETIEYLTALR